MLAHVAVIITMVYLNGYVYSIILILLGIFKIPQACASGLLILLFLNKILVFIATKCITLHNEHLYFFTLMLE